MKKWLVVFLMMVTICISPSVFAVTDSVKTENPNQDYSKSIPNPTNYVNDFAGMFPKDKVDELNSKLSKYQKSSGMEIAIITVNTLGENADISTFATDVFHKWGVGKKGANNGILIAIDKTEHKYEIRTGYGSEIVLPDALCSRFGRNELVPSFKTGDYIGGVNKLVDAIIKQVGSNSADIAQFQKLYKDKQKQEAQAIKNDIFNTLIGLVLLVLLTILITLGIKKHKIKKELLDKSKILINNVQSSMYRFNSAIKDNKDAEYVNNIIIQLNNIISGDKITDIPTTDVEMNEKLCNHVDIIDNFTVKVKRFNSAHITALNVDSYESKIKDYIKSIKSIEDELTFYGIKSGNDITDKNVDLICKIVKDNNSNSNIFQCVDSMTSALESVKSSYNDIANIKSNIPNMLYKLENCKSDFPKWIKLLEDNNLSKYNDTLNHNISILGVLLKSDSSKVISQFNQYKVCEDFVKKVVTDEKNRLQRIKDEEEEAERRRRRAIQDEEDRISRAAIAAAAYSSSSYSSSSYDSGSSSSDFGGFGGGDTGGGGSGGSW